MEMLIVTKVLVIDDEAPIAFCAGEPRGGGMEVSKRDGPTARPARS